MQMKIFIIKAELTSKYINCHLVMNKSSSPNFHIPVVKAARLRPAVIGAERLPGPHVD